ncbi:28335_t:CDS:2, partial [Dentiscutata erythropus]
IFVSNVISPNKQEQEVKKFKKKKKEKTFLQVYYRSKEQFDTSPVSKTYGIKNMYKDFNHEDVIYRKPYRQSQFIDNRFDLLTWPALEEFMKEYKIQHPEKNDYVDFMINRFLVIWEAGENDEFITTRDGFGIYDRENSLKPTSNGHFAYRYYYVISPKLVLVLCSTILREELRNFRLICDIFKNVPRSRIPEYVEIDDEHDRNNDENHNDLFQNLLNSQGLKTEESDILTFPLVKVNSATVHLVNTLILNETKPDEDEVLSFFSYSNLYKAVVKYYKNEVLVLIKQNHTSLKKKLFIVLNRTHKEDLNLWKKFSTNYWEEWKKFQNSILNERDQLRDNFIKIVQNSDSEEHYQDLKSLIEKKLHKLWMISSNSAVHRWAIQKDLI